MCCDSIREHNVICGMDVKNYATYKIYYRCPLNVRVRSSINAFDVASRALYLISRMLMVT